MANLTGQRIGNYEIVSELGTGGMAVVYRARQLTIQREVAIKVIKPDLGDTDTLIRRFEREANTVASLSHPHILKVFDFGQYEGMLYLVMELMPGGTLAELLRQKPLSSEHTARLLNQIADALDYAHAQGLIHRDLKPQNILLDRQGNAHLSDFGLAKILNDTTSVTQSGVAIGTPAYMSPEQWQGFSLTPQTDLYALGIMIFQMLTGRLPFVGETPANLMYLHLQQLPPPVHGFRGDLPAELDAVFQQALAKIPEQRFASAGDLRTAFQKAISSIETPTRPAVTRESLKSHRGTTQSPILEQSTTLGVPLSNSDTPHQTRAAGSRRRLGFILGFTVLLAALVIGAFFMVRTVGFPAVGSATITDQAGVPTNTPTAVPPTSTSAIVERIDRSGVRQVRVTAGCFMMGSNPRTDPLSQREEQPAHEVCLTSSFWIDKFEVTNEQFNVFIREGGYANKAFWSEEGWDWKVENVSEATQINLAPDHPRVNISWYEAEAYANWRGGRLPTEAEWEYAARGPKALRYPWGSQWDKANLNGENTLRTTASVGSYPGGVSWSGAYDMSGNVWEWVADWYSDSYYDLGVESDPAGPSTGTDRVRRGGSWKANPTSGRGAYRFYARPEGSADDLGFRIVTPVS